MNASYSFPNMSADHWNVDQINEIRDVLDNLDFHIELPTKVVWIGNPGQFPKNVYEHPVVQNFFAEVKERAAQVLQRLDLESENFDLQNIVEQVRSKYRIIGGL